MGDSLIESVTLNKNSEPQGGRKPDPPVENCINNKSGMEYTVLKRYSPKGEPQCTLSRKENFITKKDRVQIFNAKVD